ncbi:MAG: hypothetical protein GY810_08590 [Aureispira sp.]|nr:hypothetical protein [Aureispira sp.]
MNYNYSIIPPKGWFWDLSCEDDYMTVELTKNGLQYIGTDWTSLSGGEYSGGFQTYEKFIEIGGIQRMPKDIQEEILSYIQKHRGTNGSSLRLVLDNQADNVVLQQAFVNMNDKPLLISNNLDIKTKEEQSIYEGSISKEEHQLSFLFVAKTPSGMQKINGEFPIIPEPNKTLSITLVLEEKNNNVSLNLQQQFI